MQVITIYDTGPEIHEDGCSGLIHLDPIYHDLEKHPEIVKHRPRSPWGDCFLAQFDNSKYFTWVKPVAGGAYQTTDPVFLVKPCKATSSTALNKSFTGKNADRALSEQFLSLLL